MHHSDIITVPITPAQANILRAYVNGSEYLDAAMDAGVTWTDRELRIPRSTLALVNIAGFIGQRAEISEDNLDYEAADGFASMTAADRTEARVAKRLRVRFEETTGVRTGTAYTDMDVAALLGTDADAAISDMVAASTTDAALQVAWALPLRVLLQVADQLYLEARTTRTRRDVLARRIVDELRPVQVCTYQLSCSRPATTTIDAGALVGTIPVCDPCAALYARLTGGAA